MREAVLSSSFLCYASTLCLCLLLVGVLYGPKGQGSLETNKQRRTGARLSNDSCGVAGIGAFKERPNDYGALLKSKSTSSLEIRLMHAISSQLA